MDTTVLVALISFCGTAVGTAGGLIASARLTSFRLSQLEAKLDSQGKRIAKIPVMEEKIHGLSRRISVLEHEPAPVNFS